MSAHLEPERGRPRQPGVVRECLGWGAFATVVVPAVLILTGADVITAALGAGVVAALTASIFVVVRMTGLSLPLLGTSESADAPAPPPPQPLAPAWVPDPVEAEHFPMALDQPWHEYAWIPDSSIPPEERGEFDVAAPVPHFGDTALAPPWPLPIEPIGPGLGSYPDQADGRPPPWEDDRSFTEVYHPPEPWLPEPRVDQSELHPAEQRGRHRRGP